jgi:hypothetical protein
VYLLKGHLLKFNLYYEVLKCIKKLNMTVVFRSVGLWEVIIGGNDHWSVAPSWLYKKRLLRDYKYALQVFPCDILHHQGTLP